MVKRIFPILLFAVLVARTASAQLTLADVQTVIAQAVTRATVLPMLNTNAVVAVTDREGWVLGVWSLNTNLLGDDNLVAEAIAKAGTAAFLSSDNNAFSSRTAGDIVQQHFPIGIRNKPPGPLVGVNFSQLSFSDINKFKAPGSVITYGSSPGLTLVAPPLPFTGGLEGTPGGVPLYINGALVGGVGVAGNGVAPTNITPARITKPDSDEDVALAGQIGFAPPNKILGSKVLAAGIRLEYIETKTKLTNVISFASLPGMEISPFTLTNSPAPFAYPVATIGGETGEVRQPIINDPSFVPLGAARLTDTEVLDIITAAANRCRTTRAGIRLPPGQPAEVFITVVNNPGVDDATPIVLGTFCTSPNTTRFSWDVCVQKARTALLYSASNTACSTRTVGFLAQSFYPPGINGTLPGPLLGAQETNSSVTASSLVFTNPLNGAVFSTMTNVNAAVPNGITIFPGGFPLYRNGVLIGAIGVSGDGVDQDDLISASGAALFPAPISIRADQTEYRGTRLPYAKFPRNPGL